MGRLFTEGKANTKLSKGEGGDYLILGLFLAPSKENGMGVDLCPFASDACRAACLNTAGRAGIFPTIAIARKRKAVEFLSDRKAFTAKMVKEIERGARRASKQGKKAVIRLNGTTDIRWSRTIMLQFPTVQFYDYTKDYFKMVAFLRGELPVNYHLTFSYSGENIEQCKSTLALGGHVAVVFSSHDFPETWLGYPVTTGEENDLRFLDATGPRIIGLKAKGKARIEEIGGSFVIQIDKAKDNKTDKVRDSRTRFWTTTRSTGQRRQQRRDNDADIFSQAIDNAELLLAER